MPDIEHCIQIAAEPAAIYPLVATANGFGQWWAEDITEADGSVSLAFFNRSTIYRVRLGVDQAPSVAEWTCDTGDEWNGTRLVFRLQARGSGTVLRFTHANWRGQTEYFTSCNTTWGTLMYRLKAGAEGKSPGPLFLAGSLAY